MKLANAEMLIAFGDKDWPRVLRIMSDHFGKPFSAMPFSVLETGQPFTGDGSPLEVNILADGYRYVWEEYDGFWSRRSILVDSPLARIFTR